MQNALISRLLVLFVVFMVVLTLVLGMFPGPSR
jgi:hypothetical protein